MIDFQLKQSYWRVLKKSDTLFQDSYLIPLPYSPDKLHIHHIYKHQEGPPVFMLHGAIEDGRIFYSKSGKGLAPYLARHGYDVYIGDLRGRGNSSPRISRHSHYGQTEQITEDIPALLGFIRQQRGPVKQHWIAHSWGGVLLNSYWARFPEFHGLVHSMTFIASKRVIHVKSLKKILVMDLIWGPVARLLIKIFGYLPMNFFQKSADNESDKSHLAIMKWVNPKQPWVDLEDGFDYGKSILKTQLPPTLHLAGISDAFLGHPQDVKKFLEETGAENFEYRILSQKNGNRRNYGHIDIMTHDVAIQDHFPEILKWLKQHEKNKSF